MRVFLQVIPLGEFGTLSLSANGAVIGRARRSDEVHRGWCSVRPSSSDHTAVDLPTSSENVTSVAILRKIPSVVDQRDTANNDSTSRDYFRLKPETVMTSSSGRHRSDAFDREQRQRRSMSDIAVDQSRHPLRLPVQQVHSGTLPVHQAWRQPETFKAGGGTASRRARPQASGSLMSSVDFKEHRQRAEYQGQPARDAVHTSCHDDIAQQRNSREKLHHRKQTDTDGRDLVRRNVKVEVIDVDHAPAVDGPQTGGEMLNKEVTPVDERSGDSEGGLVMTSHGVVVSSASMPLTHHKFTSSLPELSYTAPPSVATFKSTAAVVAKSKQIWWPCQESSDDEEEWNDDDADDDSSETDGDDNKDDTVDTAIVVATASGADHNDNVANVTPWTEINASFEESIRELDMFLQQQDSDSL